MPTARQQSAIEFLRPHALGIKFNTANGDLTVNGLEYEAASRALIDLGATAITRTLGGALVRKQDGSENIAGLLKEANVNFVGSELTVEQPH